LRGREAEAIQPETLEFLLDCFAVLAMTEQGVSEKADTGLTARHQPDPLDFAAAGEVDDRDLAAT
jgi:hypothetical protein